MTSKCPVPPADYHDHAQALLRHQLAPALVLDPAGTVVAVNPAGVRLLCSCSSDAHAVVGEDVSKLNIALAPTSDPALWTWESVLAEAVNASAPVERDDPGQNHRFHDPDTFWELEARDQSVIESDVYLVKTASPSTSDQSGGARETFRIKARASVRWSPPGAFLVVFSRPCAPSLRKDAPSPTHPSTHPDIQSSAPPTLATNTLPQMLSALQVTSLIPYIMAVLDLQGQVLQLSDFWYQFTGLGQEESLGSGWVTAIHADDVVAMTNAWGNVLQTHQKNWTHEARYLEAATGEYCWFLIRAQVCEDSSGHAVCWYASMMDINDAVIARQDVDRRRQSMLTLISRTDVLLWGIDSQHHLFIREGGLKWDPPRIPAPTEAAQTTPNASGAAHCDNDPVSLVQSILAGREFTPVVEHTEDQRHFRTIFVAEHHTTADQSAAEAALALTFDITDQVVQSALRLENARLALDEKAALEASALKSRFLANMSHEIRTPISGIIGLSDLLRESEVTKDQADLIRDIRCSAEFLLALVNDILDLSKISSGQLSIECIPFSLCETIADTLVSLQIEAAKKQLELKWTHDASTESTFLGDPHRIRQILTNLVGNSLKFTHHGSVQLSVTTLQEGSRVSRVQFAVQDSGIGIAEDVQKTLFKPFSQADTSTARIYGGTGLGLSICQELVGLMGGHMTVQSTLGEGTTVTFELPFKTQSRPSPEAKTHSQLPERPQVRRRSTVATIHSSKKNSKRSQQPLLCVVPSPSPSTPLVLIVDDNPLNLKINTRFLSNCGFSVATAVNGQEALDYLCKNSVQRRPDVIFMDCMMPVVDGYEATRRIRSDVDLFDERTRQVPIVGLTASALQSDRDRCWEVGMDDFICRPVERKALNDAVRKWATIRDA